MFSKFFRLFARLYPIEMGKGWIAYLLKDRNIPDGELVRTTEGVLLRTRPDYMFKHAYLFGEYGTGAHRGFQEVSPTGGCLL